jgi:hypothetical protein
MNTLTAVVIAMWSGSLVSFGWSYLAGFFTIQSEVTVVILQFIAFVCFLIGLGCFIARIIQWARLH